MHYTMLFLNEKYQLKYSNLQCFVNHTTVLLFSVSNLFVAQGKYFNCTMMVCFLSLIFSSIPPKRFVIVDYK